jgi:hypothetical protein
MRKSILDPSFRYVSAARTDIRRTFARIRREQAAEAKAREAERANVQPIQQRRKSQ